MIVVFCGFFNVSSYGQIITSKKEAQKSGQYRNESDTKSNEKAVVATSRDVKSAKPVSNSTSGKTSVKEEKKSYSQKFKIVEETVSDYIPESIESYLALQITYNAMDFLGVRYRGGGTTRDGMDCSGFVTTVLNIFDIKLPRSSHEMATVGEKVSKEDAKIGDLIFFKTTSRSRISHVGIISEIDGDEIKFVHSSTSLGVVVSSLSEAYYKKTFTQINRILI